MHEHWAWQSVQLAPHGTSASRLQTRSAARCSFSLLCRQVPEGYTVLTEGQASILQSGNSVFYNPVQASPSIQASMPAFGPAAPCWLHPDAKALAGVGSCQSLSKCVIPPHCSAVAVALHVKQGLHCVHLGSGFHYCACL